METLFYLTPLLEYIDFHIISHWTLNVGSSWHIGIRCRYIGYFFYKQKGIFYMHFPTDTYHSLWWTSCGPFVGTENSPNCKCGIDLPCMRIQTFAAECLSYIPPSFNKTSWSFTEHIVFSCVTIWPLHLLYSIILQCDLLLHILCSIVSRLNLLLHILHSIIRPFDRLLHMLCSTVRPINSLCVPWHDHLTFKCI